MSSLDSWYGRAVHPAGILDLSSTWENAFPQYPDLRPESRAVSECDLDPSNVGLNAIGNLAGTKPSPRTMLVSTGFLHRHEIWSQGEQNSKTIAVEKPTAELVNQVQSLTVSNGAIEKINRLETEIDDLRRLIARLVHVQETSLNAMAEKSRSPLATPLPDAASTPTCSAPPPPPPPPPPPLPPPNWRTPVNKTSSISVPNSANSTRKVPPPSRTRFSVTARDLTSVRLKKIDRSPGGTPLREKNHSDPSDPGVYLAAVLRSRFSALNGSSPSPSPRDGTQTTSPTGFDGENEENSSNQSLIEKTPTTTMKKHRLHDSNSASKMAMVDERDSIQ